MKWSVNIASSDPKPVRFKMQKEFSAVAVKSHTWSQQIRIPSFPEGTLNMSLITETLFSR